MVNVAVLARALHDARCAGFAAGYCDGGKHLARYQALAREITSAADPAGTLHERLCDAQLDPTTECPNARRHAALMGSWLAELPREGTP